MKKATYALLIVAVMSFVFACGLLVGRNMNRSSITVVPSTAGSVDSTDQEPAYKKININTASVDELTVLPGIGRVLAQRIVDYRTTFGPFRTEVDLCNVEGIGQQKLSQLLDYITS